MALWGRKRRQRAEVAVRMVAWLCIAPIYVLPPLCYHKAKWRSRSAEHVPPQLWADQEEAQRPTVFPSSADVSLHPWPHSLPCATLPMQMSPCNGLIRESDMDYKGSFFHFLFLKPSSAWTSTACSQRHGCWKKRLQSHPQPSLPCGSMHEQQPRIAAPRCLPICTHLSRGSPWYPAGDTWICGLMVWACTHQQAQHAQVWCCIVSPGIQEQHVSSAGISGGSLPQQSSSLPSDSWQPQICKLQPRSFHIICIISDGLEMQSSNALLNTALSGPAAWSMLPASLPPSKGNPWRNEFALLDVHFYLNSCMTYIPFDFLYLFISSQASDEWQHPSLDNIALYAWLPAA